MKQQFIKCIALAMPFALAISLGFKEDKQNQDAKNYVLNGGFETNTKSRTPDNWLTEGDGDSDFSLNQGQHSGTYKLGHYKKEEYKVTTYQLLNNLPNGTYTLKGWIYNGGGQKACYLFAGDTEGKEQQLVLEPWAKKGWQQVTLEKIEIKSGKCKLGLHSDANANNWISLDDVELTKN
jgi:arabinogalactan endo-1,4-beta-galactosidase